jgi:hypothetical protein
MAEITAARFKATTVFGIDLLGMLAADTGEHRRLQERRASDQLWDGLVQCLAGNSHHFGQWIDEGDRIKQRMSNAARAGGREVWQRRFLRRHSPLLLANHNYHMFVSGNVVRPGNALDPSGTRYDMAFLEDELKYRITRDGVLVASYAADFRRPTYAILDVIRSLTHFRRDSFETLYRFLGEYFGNQQRRELLGAAVGVQLAGGNLFNKGAISEAIHFHSVAVLEGFRESVDGVTSDVPLTRVVRSPELAGILNEATWYDRYDPVYCDQVANKQFGYRRDEIYVIDRRTTVIVADRCWRNDPMAFFRQDIHLVVIHHIAAIALVMQQLAFFRDAYNEARLIEAQEPFHVLPLVLAARSNLTLLHESLDFGSLVRHGFTRLFARHLRQEMEFERALEALTQRVDAMGESIMLKSSVQSAQASLARASRNNMLQTLAVILALIALILTIVLGA